MANVEKNAEIAKFCGWRMKKTNPDDPILGPLEEVFCSPEDGWNCNVPDYLGDLNEIAEAELILAAKPYGNKVIYDYVELLEIATCGESWCASAEMRAEALLEIIKRNET